MGKKNFTPAAENAANNPITATAATSNAANEQKGRKEGNDNNKPPRKRRQVSPMWGVMTKARPVFDVQLEKDNTIKLKCVEKFMNAAYPDGNKFWADFMEQVNILLDSRKYCRECEILGFKPEYVAEHIVFLGSATMKKVLKDGVSRTLGADVQLYKERFSPKEADKFLMDVIKQLPEHTPVA